MSKVAVSQQCHKEWLENLRRDRVEGRLSRKDFLEILEKAYREQRIVLQDCNIRELEILWLKGLINEVTFEQNAHALIKRAGKPSSKVPAKCKDIRKKADRIFYELGPVDEFEQVELHRKGCSSCNAVIEVMQQIRQRLSQRVIWLLGNLLPLEVSPESVPQEIKKCLKTYGEDYEQRHRGQAFGIIDSDYELVFTTPSFANRLGYDSPEQLHELPWSDLFSPRELSKIKTSLHYIFAMAQGMAYRLRYKHREPPRTVTAIVIASPMRCRADQKTKERVIGSFGLVFFEQSSPLWGE